MNKIFNL